MGVGCGRNPAPRDPFGKCADLHPQNRNRIWTRINSSDRFLNSPQIRREVLPARDSRPGPVHTMSARKPKSSATPSPAQRVAKLFRAGKLPILIRGRAFGLRDLRVILVCAHEHRDRSRTFISQEICRRLEWKQPNGWLKERACRDVLRHLQRRRLVRLPSPKSRPQNNRVRPRAFHRELSRQRDFHQPVRDMPVSIRFELAKGNMAERLWNYVVDRFHYLGYRVSVGRTLKYLVWGDDLLVAAISFSSPAWRLEPRDRFLSALGWEAAEIQERVINNARFLILPNVQVEHLASRVLALACEQARKDWTWYYGIRPSIVETFVSTRRFEGTCYRAANWLVVGSTRGFTKSGATHRNGQQPKQIFLYGLSRHVRATLQRSCPSAEDAGVREKKSALSRAAKKRS